MLIVNEMFDRCLYEPASESDIRIVVLKNVHTVLHCYRRSASDRNFQEAELL